MKRLLALSLSLGLLAAICLLLPPSASAQQTAAGGGAKLLEETMEGTGPLPEGWAFMEPWMKKGVVRGEEGDRRWFEPVKPNSFVERIVDLPPEVRKVTLTLDARTHQLEKGEKPHQTVIIRLEFLHADGKRTRSVWKKDIFLQPGHDEWESYSTTVEVPENTSGIAVVVGTDAVSGSAQISNIVLAGE